MAKLVRGFSVIGHTASNCSCASTCDLNEVKKPATKPSFDAVSALLREITPEQQVSLLNSDNRPALRVFLQNLINYPVAIDYNKSFVEMAEETGYKEIEEEISSKNFPVNGN